MFNEDYAVYLQQAWNIAHSIPMSEMGVIQYHDPHLPLLFQSPLSYPPLLPLLYAPLVSNYGLDLMFFKYVQLGILAAGLWLFCYAMRRWRFSILETSLSVVIFALSYEVRRSANSIGADLPWIFFLVLALLAIQRFIAETGRSHYIDAALAGGAIFLALDMRTAAVALFPTLLIADLLALRRLRFLGLGVAAMTAAALAIVQNLVLHSAFSYGGLIQYSFLTPIENLRQFYDALFAPLSRSAFPELAQLGLIILIAFAAVGSTYEALRGAVVAIFIVTYTAMLLVLPDFNAGARYLVPHLLVLGAFAVRGATLSASLIERWPMGQRVLRTGVATVGVLWSVLVPSPLPAGTWDFGVMAAPAQDTFKFLRDHLHADALVAATKYRSFHYFAQRKAIRIPVYTTPDGMNAWLHEYRVAAVVIKHSPPHWKYDYTDCPSLPWCRPGFTVPGVEVFRNSDFSVFEMPKQHVD